MKIKAYIQEITTKALLNSFGIATEASAVTVLFPRDNFGDFATNVAFKLAKNTNQTPAAFAQLLAAAVAELDAGKVFLSVKAVNGFVNFALSLESLAQVTYSYTNSISLDSPFKQKIVFEYSSPNTNKPLHIGHVRNNLYGKACINLLKVIGNEVISCEIINDRGIHIMKSLLMYQLYGNGQTPETTGEKPDHFVGRFYALFSQKAAESEAKEKELLQQAGELLRQWEAGDVNVRALWKQMNDWVHAGMQATYVREGSTFDEVDYESQIYDKGKELVLQGVEKGVFQYEEDGSVSVDLTDKKLDKKYLLRKDSTTIYITQDLYLWHTREERHHPDVAIVTTAAEQSYHFAVLKELFKLLHFPWADKFKHLPYEHVYLGKSKMSARSGNTVTADELLVQVKEKVRELMRGIDKHKAESSDDALVEQIAFGAIKYGYLKYEPNSRIYFDIDETIKLEGNTGPYIQYAHARVQNIIQKVDETKLVLPCNITDPAALLVQRQLLKYGFIVEAAASEFKPNLLCTYLYELASLINGFYAQIPVSTETDKQRQAELITVLTAARNVLAHGLNLLGIAAPNQM